MWFMTTPAADPAALPDDDDPDTLDDQALELDLDAADPDDGEPGDPDTGDEGSDVAVTGVCRGGPYNGRTVTSRLPSGFLLADKPNGKAYVYDWASDVFTCRDAAGTPLDEDGRWKAAEGGTYDVIAYEDDPAALTEVHP